MAISTADVYVKPVDGWVLVAAAPTALIIKPANYHPWWVAIADAEPADDLIGIPMGRNSDNRQEAFTLPSGTEGNVYIRTREPVSDQPATQQALFAVYAVTAD